jgi:hypothetical protein
MPRIFFIFVISVICIFSAEEPSVESFQYSTENDTLTTSNKGIQIENAQDENDSDLIQVSKSSTCNFNPLSYQSRVMMSGCFHFFNYKKHITKEYVGQNFTNRYGYSPDTIGGQLKSNEYGFLFGLWFKYMKRFYPSGIFIRPQVQFCIGPNQYKGVNDVEGIIGGVEYTSGDTFKQTFLIHVANDLGYCNTNSIVPFAIYTGVRLSYWNRDFAPLENYYASDWASFPLGLILYKPLGPQWTLGLDISADYIIGGDLYSDTDSEDQHYTQYPKTLRVGDNLGYRFELTAEFLIKKWFSLQITQFVNIYKFKESKVGKAWVTRINNPGNTVIEDEFFYKEPRSSTLMLGCNFTFTGLFLKDE